MKTNLTSKLLFISLLSVNIGCSLWSKEEKSSEIVMNEISSPSGKKVEKDTEDPSLLDQITQTMKSGVEAIGEGVGTIADKTISAVGLGDKKVEEKISGNLTFSHIHWGEIPQKHFSKYQGKSISVIKSAKELFDFKANASTLNSSKVMKSLSAVDFNKELILVVFAEFSGAKRMSSVTSITYGDVLEIDLVEATEEASCNAYIRSGQKGLSYQMISIEKPKFEIENYSVKLNRNSTRSFCSSDFGNYSQLSGAQEVKYTELENFSFKKGSSKSEVSLGLFKNKWGSWDSFKTHYCQNCDKYENEVGFPNKKILLSIAGMGEGGNNESKYVYKLEGISYVSGFWYFDITKSTRCTSDRGNHSLISIDKSELPGSGLSLSYDRMVVPTPFVPIKKVTCQ